MAEAIKISEKKAFDTKNSISVDVKGQKVAVFKINEQYYGMSETCPHRGGPLSEGKLNGTIVTCPWHGAKFDVTTGKVMGPPAKSDVSCFKIFVDGDDIKIELH